MKKNIVYLLLSILFLLPGPAQAGFFGGGGSSTGSMTYPGAGIPATDGAQWLTSYTFSTNTALGTSDTVISSQLAIKTYIDAKISDTAYDATTWDAVTTIAPSKNAIRDYLESKIPAGADGTWQLILQNNTTFTPTASTYGLAYVAGLPKFNINATKYSPTYSADASPIILTTGGTTARTITLPDAAITVARIDAGQTFTGVQNFASQPTGITDRLGATFDGGGSAIAVNKIAYVHIPYLVTAINQWTVLCDVNTTTSGIVITPYMDAYGADTLPTTTMCTSGTPPTVASGAHKTGQAAWDCNITSIPADRMIAFKVTTAPTASTWCTVSLKVTR